MEIIYLNKDLVIKDTLTENGVLAYVALRTIMDESAVLRGKERTTECVSVNKLAFSLIGEIDYEGGLINSLVKGINELSDGNYITVRKDLSTPKSKEYIIDLSGLYINTKEEFTVNIYPREVVKILANEEFKMCKRINMLKYFIALVSTFDWRESMKCIADMPDLQGKLGHMTQSYICKQADNSERSCQRYNEVLMDMKLLYVHKSGDFVQHENVKGNSEVNYISHCYSRYADKSICEMYASNYENMYGVEHKIVASKKNKSQADHNRRLGAIYNQICMGNTDYDEATIKEVHKYVVNKNKALQEDINDKYSQSYLTASDELYVEKLQSQMREVSIFEQFDFLTCSPNGEDVWGEPDPLIDFSVEEMLDMPTLGEVQSKPSNLQSEGGKSETFGTANTDSQKSDSRKFDSEEIACDVISTTDDDLWETDSVEEIDIGKIVLSEKEAWELFA